jgi:AraC-like DNA-binding protein
MTNSNILKLYIKYMVSIRCKMAVKAALESMGLHYRAVELGEADVKEDLTPDQLESLKHRLKASSLLLMDDKKAMLIEKIKNVIVEMVHYDDEPPAINFSQYLSDKLHHDYSYLASLFSEVTGTTVEHFIIAHKIEKVKELLLYDELNLTEISYKLNYSSVAHLSNQFKKVTGLTPTYFKNLREHKKRIQLEDVGE